MKKEILKVGERNPDYLFQLLLAEKHENQLLQAKIQSLIVKNENFAFDKFLRFIYTFFQRNKLFLLLPSFILFIFIIISVIIALYIYFNVFLSP